MPTLRGEHVSLRVLQPQDYDSLRMIETSSDIAVRWRFRGATPSPEQWAAEIWHNALAQFIVLDNRQTPIGLVVLYQADFRNGHAYLAATRFDLTKHSPLMMLGIGLFLEYLFATWDLRKIYMEVPEYNFEQFQSGIEHFFDIEGRRRQHVFLAGRYWDEFTLAIYRDKWREQGRAVIESQTRRSERRIRVRMPTAGPPATGAP